MARKAKKAMGREGAGDEDYGKCVAALERLMAQEPADNQLEDPELREILEEQGHVPVTQVNVAKEAGISRKALAKGGRFEDLGARIKSVRSTHGVLPSTTAQLAELGTELDQARQTIVVLRSRVAEAILRADRAEASVDKERKHVARLRQQLAGARK